MSPLPGAGRRPRPTPARRTPVVDWRADRALPGRRERRGPSQGSWQRFWINRHLDRVGENSSRELQSASRTAVDPTVSATETDITVLLKAWAAGDQGALEQLTPIVYGELRRQARRYMRQERAGHTLQGTALANEAFLRLADVAGVDWESRSHFFAVAAQIMRRILVDAARARVTDKRGGGFERVEHSTALRSGPPAEPPVRAGHGTLPAGRRAGRPGEDRSPPGARHRVTVLWRVDGGGDSRDPADFTAKRDARLAVGPRVADAGAAAPAHLEPQTPISGGGREGSV